MQTILRKVFMKYSRKSDVFFFIFTRKFRKYLQFLSRKLFTIFFYVLTKYFRDIGAGGCMAPGK